MKKSSVVFAVRVAFVLLTTSLSAFAQEQEGSNLRVTFTTGSDDLRTNAWVFLKITRADGSAMEEIPLGSGFPQNSEVVKEKEIQGVLRLSEIRSITIRHDGSPKDMFETYDNWDLQAVSIALVSNDSGEFLNIYNSANDRNRLNFVQRFTGAKRSVTLYRQRTQP